MSFYLGVSHSTGATLFATLERLSDGFFWNQTTGAWVNNPAAADRKIPLTAGTGANVGSYTTSVSGLGDAGYIRIRVHDDADAADKTIAGGQTYIHGGGEVDGPELIAIKTKTDLLGSAKVYVTTPVSPGGDVTLFKGDTYSDALGRALDWTEESTSWPTLTGATITFEVEDGLLIVTGSVITATGSNKKVRAEPTGAQTQLLDEGTYPYRVVATLSGSRVTLAQGDCYVKDREDE